MQQQVCAANIVSVNESRSHTDVWTGESDGKLVTPRGTVNGRAQSEISNAMPLSEVVKPLKELT